MLSQFRAEAPHHITLANLNFSFAKDVYPVGRLDADSEGLLLLSNNKKLNAQLLHPKRKKPKTYWVQVEGIPDEKKLQSLRKGVAIRIKGKTHQTQPCKAELLDPPPILPERNPPIRVRKSIPDCWLSITLTEGKNRQIRRMCAAVGFPVLRLVRSSIAGFVFDEGALAGLQPGDVREVKDEDLV